MWISSSLFIVIVYYYIPKHWSRLLWRSYADTCTKNVDCVFHLFKFLYHLYILTVSLKMMLGTSTGRTTIALNHINFLVFPWAAKPGNNFNILNLMYLFCNYFLYCGVRFEGGGGGQNGIQQYPTLSDIGGPFSLKETFLWFDMLLAALDCYTWSFSESLLSPSEVFAGKQHIYNK